MIDNELKWCADCGGSGVKNANTCPTCGGDGVVKAPSMTTGTRGRHFDETLTRRDVIEALQGIAREYTNGLPEAQRLADAFKELAKALS